MTDRKNQSVATLDHAPFFERAFRYGVQQGLIDQARIEEITQDAANGTIQIAEYFGASSHLRPNLEDASKKMVSLVSLYLEDTTDGDLERSARLLREKPFRTLSRGGSSMLKSLYALPEDKHSPSTALKRKTRQKKLNGRSQNPPQPYCCNQGSGNSSMPSSPAHRTKAHGSVLCIRPSKEDWRAVLKEWM